jgi:hypothetical protein
MSDQHRADTPDTAGTPEPPATAAAHARGDDRVPTRVMMYTLAADPGQVTPIAEFTYDSARGGVTFIELDARWSRPAQRLYRHGIATPGRDRTITVNDGPAFMRALLVPARTSMYGFLDKSDEPA